MRSSFPPATHDSTFFALSHEPDRLRLAFGSVLDIDEILEIEPGRTVAFEYIGAQDYLGEVAEGRRHRGSRTTSADAAIRYSTRAGHIEISLIEWKYTEDYRGRELSVDPGKLRRHRYEEAWRDATCPIRRDVVSYEDLFVEPFYQLLRQQLLAWRMEQAGELDATRVRVVHVSPHANLGLRTSLNRPSHHDNGTDVFEIWRAMLQAPDRFVTLDSSVFTNSAVTSVDYVHRYG